MRVPIAAQTSLPGRPYETHSFILPLILLVLLNASGILDLVRVEVHCECARASDCCSPERMFVKVMLGLGQMEKKGNFIEQVPATVTEMDVACYDHLTPFGTMAANWADVKSYLNGEINGTQLGSRVWRK